MKKQPYEPPKLEEYQYTLVTAGFSFPIGTDTLDPMTDFLENPTEAQ